MSSTCPTRDSLAAYAMGKISSDRSEEIDMHLDECGTCLAELETCGDASDTLLSRLREPDDSAELLVDAECIDLLNRVAAIGHEPSFTSGLQLRRSADPGVELGDVGPYRLLGKLGAGGMGTVYKAFHTKLKRVVALKMLPTNRIQNGQAVARFEREMEAVGQLVHPNIVLAHDAGDHDSEHFLVMECVDGIDLSNLLRRHGPLPVAEACEIIRQAASGLQYAHENGLVHRDIKPSNLMLTRDGTVKILDLGLALLPETGEEASELTNTGQAMGTLDYMAPEQLNDSHAVDAQADIYSLGATFYKLLSGQAPFSGSQFSTPPQKLMALTSEEPSSITERREGLPDALAAIVDNMLAKSPADRYASATEIIHDLTPFTQGADLAALLAEQADRDESAAPATIDRVQSDRQRAVAKTTTLAPQRARVSRNAVIAAIGFAAVVLLGIVLSIRLGDVTVTVQTPDGKLPEDVKVVLKGDGEEFQISSQDNWAISVTPGDYSVQVFNSDNSIRFVPENDRLVISRGNDAMITVQRTRLPSPKPSDNLPSQAKPPQAQPIQSIAAFLPESDDQIGYANVKKVIPGLVPRPAKLPGIRRWQIIPSNFGIAEYPVERVLTVSPDKRFLTTFSGHSADSTLRIHNLKSGAVDGVFFARRFCYGGRWNPASDLLCIHPDSNVAIISPAGELLTKIALSSLPLEGPFDLWSPNGDKVIIPIDGKWHILDNSGKSSAILQDAIRSHRTYVAAWSGDGQRIALWTDGNLGVWNSDGSLVAMQEDFDNRIESLTLNFDGSCAAYHIREIGYGIWRIDKGSLLKLSSNSFDVSTCWSPDGSLLGVKQHRIAKVFDQSGDLQLEINVGLHGDFHWSPDGRYFCCPEVIAAGSGGWKTYRVGATSPKVAAGPGRFLRWMENSQQFLVLDENDIVMCGINGGRGVVSRLAERPKRTRAIGLSPDEDRIAVAYNDRLCLWDNRGKMVWSAESNLPSQVAWHPSGRYFAVSTLMPNSNVECQIEIWNADGTHSSSFIKDNSQALIGKDGWLTRLRWSPDGKWLLACHRQGWMLFDSEGNVHHVSKHDELLEHMNAAWSPDSKRFAFVDGLAYSVSVINLDGETERVLLREAKPDDRYHNPSLAWSPDGQRIAASFQLSARLWRLDGEPNKSRSIFNTISRDWHRIFGNFSWRDNETLVASWENKDGRGFRLLKEVYTSDNVETSSTRFPATFHSHHQRGKSRFAAALHHPGAGSYRKSSYRLALSNQSANDFDWLSTMFTDGSYITYTPRGELLHVPDRVEELLTYVIEQPGKVPVTLTRSEFLARIGLPEDQQSLFWAIDVGVSIKMKDGLPAPTSDTVSLPVDLPSIDDVVGLSCSGRKCVNDEAAAFIARMTSLTELNLEGTSVTAFGVAQLQNLKELRHLKLNGTKVTGRVPELSELQNLESLDLSDTSVSDFMVPKLIQLKKLKQLGLQGTEFTATGVERLRQALPECNVTFAEGEKPNVRSEGKPSVADVEKIDNPNLGGQTTPANSPYGTTSDPH